MEVLHVIEDERLQANALDVGPYVQQLIRETLVPKHAKIGDVRGRGLIFGVEFVTDRATREPDAACAEHVMNHCRTHSSVLVSTDGPHRNVIKMKPPMCVTRADGDALVAAIDNALADYR